MARLEATEVRPGVFAPMVTVTLAATVGGALRTLNVSGTVDSGADVTIIPAVLLPPEHSWDDLQPSPSGGKGSGAGGAFEMREFTGSTMAWRGTVFASDLKVAQPGSLVPVLLGRADFFKTFAIQFQWHKEPPVFHVKTP